MQQSDFLSYIRSVNIDRHLLHGKRSSEENVKIKIVIPLLITLGWELTSDMDFECMRADIVLSCGGKPAMVVETKSWGALISASDSLHQCLEYAFKLRTPWVMITSGQDTAVYCSLINPDDLTRTEPVLTFGFDELCGSQAEQTILRLSSLIGKKQFIKSPKVLHEIMARQLKHMTIDQARTIFLSKAASYKTTIKSKRVTMDEFFTLVEKHSKDCRDALKGLYEGLLEIAKHNKNIKIRYRTRAIGLEYHLSNKHRKNVVGIIGIYPHDAHVSLSPDGLQKLNVPKAMIDEIAKFPRKPDSKKWRDNLLSWLSRVVDAIHE